MVHSKLFSVQHSDDGETWRRELCPGCGTRLLGLRSWREHGPRHGWGAEWFAARVRAARPGEIIRVNPNVFGNETDSLRAETVEDATWKTGIPA
jgi:hypothetical protein